MKTIFIHTDDDIFEQIKEVKGKQTWLEFIMEVVQNKLKGEKMEDYHCIYCRDWFETEQELIDHENICEKGNKNETQ